MKESYHKLRIKAFRYALRGLLLFLREPHARIHLFATTAAIVLSFILEIDTMEWIAVLLCCALVLSLEAVNSAIEHLTDLAHPDWHPTAGRVKDISAAAVLIASMFAAT